MLEAGMPSAYSLETWSRISASKGEKTTVMPGNCVAGNWKHSDLP